MKEEEAVMEADSNHRSRGGGGLKVESIEIKGWDTSR